MSILSDSGHIVEEHTNCRRDFCQICEGGLFICTRCNLAEGALTTECPGSYQTADRADEVYKGNIDFRNGVWIEGISAFSPANFRQK